MWVDNSAMTKPHADAAGRHDWIDVEALARRAEPLAGAFALHRLSRVVAGVPDLPGAADVQWQVQAEWREPPPAVAAAVRALAGGQRATVPRQLWLRLGVQGAVPLVCQRCLEPFWQPLTVDRWFRFVADEATALAEDDGCEEDLLVLEGPRYPLRELVEDELLLAMPLVPMHAVCPHPIPLAAGDRLGAAAEVAPQQAPREHPFAALAALKPKTQRP
ncbi:Large ribosomal RNA subunit accumulation protein YceD [Tepidimonas thermarum]|uniref:Large ribosomal RNA subunit accumulation protein YceD n=2 Tax=Tepidimonas thermarum TaxID=335431 RepID=A0A554X716_9BURK|nr:Large ribosomal RNA subunit accumulation protein YceD [Tepidimonas thermarum]